MGTRSITLVRTRKLKETPSTATSILGGPSESKYIYEYFVCVWQHWDGYVEGGVGQRLAEFLCKFIHDSKSKFIDTSYLASKLVKAIVERSEDICLITLESLKDIFRTADYELAYIITVDLNNSHY